MQKSAGNFGNFYFLFSLLSFVFLPSPSQATAAEPLTSKAKSIDKPYGTEIYVSEVSEEDREISRVIQKMRQKQRSNEEINQAVQKIRKNYSLKQENLANQDFQKEIQDRLSSLNNTTDLRSFVETRLLKLLLKKLNHGCRDSHSLIKLPELVDGHLYRISPSYQRIEQELPQILINMAATREIQDQETEGIHDINSLELALSKLQNLQRRLNLDLISIRDALHSIRNKEAGISLQTPITIMDRNVPAIDRTSLRDQIKNAETKIMDRCLPRLKRRIKQMSHDLEILRDKKRFTEAATCYSELKDRINTGLQGSKWSPLKKFIVKKKFKLFSSGLTFTPCAVQCFWKEVKSTHRWASWKYQKIEDQITEIKNFSRQTSSQNPSENDDAQALTDTALSNEFDTLIQDLTEAQEIRKLKIKMHRGTFPNSFHSRSYHGDFQSTEQEAKTLLRPYLKRLRHQKLLALSSQTKEGAKWVGNQVLQGGKYVAMGTGAVIVSPVWAVYHIGKSINTASQNHWKNYQERQRVNQPPQTGTLWLGSQPSNLGLKCSNAYQQAVKKLRLMKREHQDNSKKQKELNSTTRQGRIQNQIDSLVGRNVQNPFNQFREKFPFNLEVDPSDLPVLWRATEALNQGTWSPEKTYRPTLEELALHHRLEAEEEYCNFIQSRNSLYSAQYLEGGASFHQNETDPFAQLDPGKSKEFFILNYVCLPSFPSTADDPGSECLICLCPVAFSFLPLGRFCSIPPEYDRIVQVPGASDVHKLSVCGHLVHRSCMKGYQVNRGLSIFKCPRCQSHVPYREMNREHWLKEYGFCWDLNLEIST